MDLTFENVKKELKELNKDGNAETLKGEVAFQNRDALKSIANSPNGVTRSNTKWRRCEYIIIEYRDNEIVSDEVALKGWKNLAFNHGDQTLALQISNDTWTLYNSKCVIIGGNSEFEDLIKRIKSLHNLNITSIDMTLQQIFYGAPGTGKSFQVNDAAKKYSTIRTTFHPDSDYSTFVGAYKPTMVKVRKSVVVERQEKEVTPLAGNSEFENKIQYSFVKQAFLKAYLGAWKKYTEPKTYESGDSEVQPQFLVIEEINRGNCAQIFGDLFQLLDRQEKNKFSCYPIEADADLQQEIENAFTNETTYKLTNNIYVDGAVKDYTSNYKHEDGTPCTLSEDIQSGRILLLPSNLYIWATMNTSDQSLFPIDSAFKRRWSWEYVRIAEGRDKNTHKPLRYSFNVKGIDYDWWSFIQKINERVGSITSSEDKKLGYFFCGTEDGKITADKFVSKVCFYLWNDVFKDFGFGKKDQSAPFKKADGKDISFDDFYEEDPVTFKTKVNETLLEDFIKKLGVETVEQRKQREEQTQQPTTAEQAE